MRFSHALRMAVCGNKGNLISCWLGNLLLSKEFFKDDGKVCENLRHLKTLELNSSHERFNFDLFLLILKKSQ